MKSIAIHTVGEEQTVELGRNLGTMAAPGDVFLLCGELGTGKTCLVRGLASGLGAPDAASSPSFVIVREYRGRLTLYHMDFYRLERPEEIAELGVEEYLYGDGICAVEWAERAQSMMPEHSLLLTFRYAPADSERDIVLTSRGRRYDELLTSLDNRLRGAS